MNEKTIEQYKYILSLGRHWGTPKTQFHKPWHKTPYLQQRRQQLEPVMRELDPHNPVRKSNI